MSIDIIVADYHTQKHAKDLLFLLNCYAEDDMGGGKTLPQETKEMLIPMLQKRQDAISLLAYDEDKAVGLLNAFEGFSSFAARPLLNIHDVFIDKNYRGQGIVNALLTKLEAIGKETQCTKITLEVLSNNTRAKKAYAKLGYGAYVLKDDAGEAVFWQKKID